MKIATPYTRVLKTLGFGLVLFVGFLFARQLPFLSQAAQISSSNPQTKEPAPVTSQAKESQPIAEQLQSKTTRATSFADLLSQAQTDGTVRVIVGLRARFQPEGLLGNQPAVQTQRLAIAQAQVSLLSQMTAFNVTGIKQFVSIPFLALEVDAAGLQFLQSAPEVTSIHEDVLQPLSLAESVPLIGAPAAWAAGFTGAGQTVAILDTGVDKTHPFLTGKVVSEACYSTTGTGVTSTCPGGVAQSTDPGSGVNCDAPGCEHGTHVAGIAAGKSATFSGVAREANIIAIKVATRRNGCSSGSCVGLSDSDILRGLERAYELRSTFNVAAVNMSLGGGKFTANCDASQPFYKTAIDNLRSVGIATIVASGNENYTGSLAAPACISSAISVGSTGDGSSNSSGSTATQDVVSGFSNSASFLHLLAPGAWINSSVPGTGFSIFQGTSMAAPHVAGAWAVLKSKLPNASVEQILMALKDTGMPITDTRNSLVKPRIKVDAAATALPATACSYTIAPATQAFAVSGGTGSVNVTSASGCAWTASSNVPWVTITAGSTGTSNGSVNFTVAANTGMERTGTIFVAGQTFIVTQAGVPAYAVDDGTFENSSGLGLGGNSYRVNRLTPTSYPATINAVAIFFSSGTGVRVGDSFTVLAAPHASGSVSIDGVAFSVSTTATVQALDQFNIYPIPGITVNAGDVVVGIQMNHSSGVLPFAIDQTPPDRQRSYRSIDGTTFALIASVGTPGNYSFRALPTTSLTCPTVTSINPNNGLITSTVTITGTGFTGVTGVRFANNLPAQFTVNSDTSITATVPVNAVTGRIAISKTGSNCADVLTSVFTVNPCLSLSATGQSFPTAGGTGTITLTADVAQCPWTASSNVSWITFTGTASGTGSGTVNYTVAANTGSTVRTGIITIAGRTFTVTQATDCHAFTSLSPTGGFVGATVTITGTNLTNVTAVRFSNSVTATFTINSPTQITATVPTGAVTGPLTLVKSGCSDVTTTSFTVFTTPVVTLAPVEATLTAESCTPANSAIDPGETVTMNLALRNTGNTNTTNLVATLQASGGVTVPSAAQTYGVVTAGGAAVAKPFTFTASGSCGNRLTATLSLQDGTTSLGTVTFSLLLGVPVVRFTENFDSVTAPALPTGWTATVTSGSVPAWVTSTTTSDTAPNNAFVMDSGSVSDIRLDSPGIAITTNSAQLSFRNNYNTEASSTTATGFDGGVLEIALGSGAFTDIITAGGSFVTGGYNRTISSSEGNPIAGRQAWSGNSGGYITTTVNLPPTAAGQTVKLRWRMTSDTSVSGVGWRIDTIRLTDGATCVTSCGGCPTITLAPTTLPAGTVNTAYNQTVTASGGAAPYSYTVSAGTLPTGLTLSTAGVLSGTPTQSGSFPLTIRATDANGCTGTQAYTLVLTCPTITVSPATLPGGTVNTAYNQTLTASGGATPYNFTVTSGALPGGVTLSSAGILSGTPNAAGTFTFTVTATDANNCTGTRSYTVVIQPSACLPVAVSLSTTLTGSAGGSLTVLIQVGDLTGRNVTAFDFTLTFDPAVVRLQSTPVDTAGTLSSGFTITPNTGTSGRLTVAAFGTTALTGAGTLLNVKFDLIGAAGTCSDLTWTSFRFNESTLCTNASNGRVCLTGGAIAGTVSYVTMPKPVPGVVLTAAGTPAATSTTNSSGAYNLTGLGGGPYTVTPTKTGDVNGISSFDASMVAQHVAGLLTLSSAQQSAGDASNNGSLSSFDASLIAQTVAGIPNSGIAGTWKFVPSSRSYPTLSGSQTNQNYDAVLVGDVSGNWAAPSNAAPLLSLFPTRPTWQALLEAVPVTLATTLTGAAGTSVSVPIQVADVTRSGLVAYDFVLTFDPQVMQLEDAPIDVTDTLSSGLTITTNAATPGQLRVSAFGTTALNGAGTLLKLNFRVVGAAGTSSPLAWQAFHFNEDTPTTTTPGRFVVSEPARTSRTLRSGNRRDAATRPTSVPQRPQER